jgi:hypothetical protein
LVYGPKQDNRRLRIYAAKAGETPSSVARDVLGDQHLAWQVANLNGIKEATVFREGDHVKFLPSSSGDVQGGQRLRLSPN